MSRVCVTDEWSTLKEVIVGNCINFNIDGFDLIFRTIYHANIGEVLRDNKKVQYRIQKQYAEERQEDLDNFAAQLENLGVTVRRPKQLDEAKIVVTPTFKGIMNAVDSPRDSFLLYDDCIIETPPTNRNRYFEGTLMYPVFREYYESGSNWICAPRSLLTDEMLDTVPWDKQQPYPAFINTENYDISFDAANCLKFGDKILMNVGNKNHEAGAQWLCRHVPAYLYNVRIADCHIDGKLMPLREGKLLISPLLTKEEYSRLPQFLQEWDTIMIEEDPKQFDYPPDHIQLATFEGMSTNVLSLAPDTVMVRTEDKRTIKVLESNGFTVVPVQLRHCELFGGGLHCATLDVRRV